MIKAVGFKKLLRRKFGRESGSEKDSSRRQRAKVVRIKTEDDINIRTKALYYSELLRSRRKELGITQQELADRIGRGRSYVNRIEKGETDMQLSSLLRIADALGLAVRLESGQRDRNQAEVRLL
ncbi:MAG: helix-turn-helix transcriptional regulator [Candidatus Cryptobacteroides sp.]|nr:helix-turn-helix domain-containing protein [Bacteroidales bacterium]